jgi:hypothetical protein
LAINSRANPLCQFPIEAAFDVNRGPLAFLPGRVRTKLSAFARQIGMFGIRLRADGVR